MLIFKNLHFLPLFNEIIIGLGYTMPMRVEIGVYYFPHKTYGTPCISYFTVIDYILAFSLLASSSLLSLFLIVITFIIETDETELN